MVYEETDDKFFLSLTKSGDKQYILLSAGAQVTTETRFIRLGVEGKNDQLGPRRYSECRLKWLMSSDLAVI